MSYQVLARKWRPRIFSELVGQAHVVRALSNALDNDRLHHAYLFTGTRGVGKTTLARIFAKSLNCEHGVGSTPCGQCSICTEVDEGRFIDLLEVDAASRTKVDQTRELLDNVPYAPVRGRYKVYLIDEVHMFSDSSFNALLKTLEEPPPHVKFLLATTDPQKVPVTVLSRCLQFNLKRLPLDQIQAYLQTLLEKEAIQYESRALTYLAKGADGSMRDALSLLDQAIAFGAGKVLEADVLLMLGSVAQDHIGHLLNALAEDDGVALLAQVRSLSELAPDFQGLLQDLLSTLYRLALAQAIPGSLDDSAGDQQELEALAVKLSPADIQLYYQIALTGQRDLPLAPDPQAGFEMLLLRMLAFRPGKSPSGDGGSIRQLKQATATPVAKSNPPVTSVPTPEASRKAAVPKPLVAPKSVPAPVKPQEVAVVADIDFSQWHQVVEQLNLGGISRQLANNCVFHGWDGEQLELKLDATHQNMLVGATEQRLQKAVSAILGKQVKLKITPEKLEQTTATPAKIEAKAAADKQQAAEQVMAADPMVKELETQMGAQLIAGSVRPVDQE